MEIPRHWRLKAQRYRLEGAICPTCSQPVFPPRPVCPYHNAHLMRVAPDELPVIPISNRISKPVFLER